MDNENKKLPPLTFLPDLLERPWGTLEYRLADLGFIDSTAASGWLGGNTIGDIMQTYLERVAGETAFEWYGTQFPVMVKHLDVRGRTSLHVNPDDETAEQRYDAFGKTALWYVEEAGENARLYLGFKRDVTAAAFWEACNSNSVTELLHSVTPEKGDTYLITPGLVHAAKDVKLLEVAECSELWFRLHDWGSGERELNLEEAIDLIDFRSYRKSIPAKDSTEQFRTRIFTLDRPLENTSAIDDSFLIYICLEGGAVIDVPDQGKFTLEKGEVILIPAETPDFHLIPSGKEAKLMEVHLDPRPEEEFPPAEPEEA